MELLKAEKIGVNISGKKIITGVGFSVQEKEIVTIVGDKDSGKSVFAKAIMGLLPYDGRIFLSGRSIDFHPNVTRVKLGLGFVPQSRKFFANMTVRENLLLGGYMHRDQGYVDVQLEEYYKLFPELRDRDDDRAGDIPADEQQMLAIMKALMSTPRLLIIDDPVSGVSNEVALRIYKILVAMCKQGMSVLLFDRGSDVSFKISNRVYVMEKGAVSLTGTGREMFEAWNKMHGRDVSAALIKSTPTSVAATAKPVPAPASKPADTKPADAKPAAAAAKPAQAPASKPADTKPADAKPAAAKKKTGKSKKEKK